MLSLGLNSLRGYLRAIDGACRYTECAMRGLNVSAHFVARLPPATLEDFYLMGGYPVKAPCGLCGETHWWSVRAKKLSRLFLCTDTCSAKELRLPEDEIPPASAELILEFWQAALRGIQLAEWTIRALSSYERLQILIDYCAGGQKIFPQALTGSFVMSTNNFVLPFGRWLTKMLIEICLELSYPATKPVCIESDTRHFFLAGELPANNPDYLKKAAHVAAVPLPYLEPPTVDYEVFPNGWSIQYYSLWPYYYKHHLNLPRILVTKMAVDRAIKWARTMLGG